MNPLLAAVLAASLTAAPSPRLVLHEWGTFTSIAGSDGVAIDWRPLSAPSDLPSFVHSPRNGAYRFSPQGKGSMRGTVRMETPVIYFYADQELEVSLRVDFPNGSITEWYPAARSYMGGLDWGKFKVRPGTTPPLLTEPAPSHYYPAREVDAAPVQFCGETKTEHEKFLFYRGVGTFPLPLKAKLSGKTLALGGLTGKVLIYDREGARVGVRVLDVKGDTTAELPPLSAAVEDAHRAVLDVLRGTGLYEKEARAMLETWKDTWFEDGLRVLYVLPGPTTDALLPLTVSPAPTESVRVLVGRLELLTPDRVTAVRRALEKGDEAGVKQQHGRFAEPLLKRAIAETTNAAEKKRLETTLAKWAGPLDPQDHPRAGVD